MKKKIRTRLLWLVYAIALFVVGVQVFGIVLEQHPQAAVQEISSAALPIVCVTAGDITFNEMHGYTGERNLARFRPDLTPVGSDRRISLEVYPSGAQITALSYEVRNLSGSRLIERTELTVPSADAQGNIQVSFTLKDLIDEDKEYILDLVVSTQQRDGIRYYTRILCSAENDVSEDSTAADADTDNADSTDNAGNADDADSMDNAGSTDSSDNANADYASTGRAEADTTMPLYASAVAFVEEFHNKTIEGTDTGYLSNYIEPEDDSGSSLATVDINSSMDQVTFLELHPTQETTPVYSLTEMSGTQFCLHGWYLLSVSDITDAANTTTGTASTSANTTSTNTTSTAGTASTGAGTTVTEGTASGTASASAGTTVTAGTESSGAAAADTASAGTAHWYLCQEYYRINKGFDRFHLLNYQRTMTEILDPQTMTYTDDTIELGISDDQMQVVQSPDTDQTAFVSAGRLFLADTNNDSLTLVFAWSKAQETDQRTTYPGSDLRILSADDDGNLDFLVYGYFPCGVHEGSVGIAEYHYTASSHELEEQAFLNYDGSSDLLQAQVENGTYLNAQGALYLLLDDTLYDIDLAQGTVRLADNSRKDRIVVSSSGRMAAWREGSSRDSDSVKTTGGAVVFTDLSDFSQQRISPEEGESLIPIGFMNDDLIYGIARDTDTMQDVSGTTLTPMYRIMIVDHDLQVLEDYEVDSYYVSDAVIEDNQVTLHRVQKTEDGFIEAEDDQIVNTTQEAGGSTLLTQYSDSTYGTVQRLSVSGIDADLLRYVEARQVVYEGRTSDLSEEMTALQQGESMPAGQHYYVYGTYGFDRDYRYPADAVQRAASGLASVVGDDGNYVWQRTAVERCQLDDVGSGVDYRSAVQNGEMTLAAACLDAILRYEGVSVDTESLLDAGKDTESILEEQIDGASALDLSGCSMESILYYPGIGIPVIAETQSGSVLVIGYGPERIAVWNPARSNGSSGSGTSSSQASGVQLWTRSAASREFAAAGNRFITYVKAEE